MADALQVDLSSKALAFVIDAVEFQAREYVERLESDALGDDERADIGNDLAYLEVVREHLMKAYEATD